MSITVRSRVEAVGWPPSAVLRFVSLRGDDEKEDKTAEGGHPTLRAERSALSLLHFLRAHDQPQSEWLNAISSDQTISEAVRHRAFQFAREWK